MTKKPTPLETKYAEALAFYAEPENYVAIGFFPDPPCGDFIYDFSKDHQLGDLRPGKRARAALKGKKGTNEIADYIIMLEKRIEELEKALKPFAWAVYNDNGDVTVTTSHLNPGDWLRAKKILRKGTSE